MSCVHYKFSSKLNYDTVTFDGLHISLCDLKKQIMGREKLKAADCDLQITNAQTKEGKSHCSDSGSAAASGQVPGRRLTAITALGLVVLRLVLPPSPTAGGAAFGPAAGWRCWMSAYVDPL